MPYSALANACEAILISLDDITAQGVSEIATPIGFAQLLLDPINRRGVDIQQLTGADSGHKRTVRIAYKQRALPDQVQDTKDCDSVDEVPWFETTQDISIEKHFTITINEDSLRKLCDAYSAYMALPVAARTRQGGAAASLDILRELVMDWLLSLDAFRRAINTELLDQFGLKVGGYVGGASSKTFDLIKSADHSVIPKGFNQLRQELNRTGFPGDPLVFGEGNLDFAIMSAEYGCCNAQGQEVGQMISRSGIRYYMDVEAGTALGNANAFGIVKPGFAQLLSWNKYVGNFARPIGTKERGTWADPLMPGLRYDFSLQPNECEEYYDLKFDVYFDLFVTPTDLFKVGDRLQGVNGTFKAVANAAA